MVNFVDPDQNPEADPEALIISDIFRETDPEIDVEKVKMKAEKKTG